MRGRIIYENYFLGGQLRIGVYTFDGTIRFDTGRGEARLYLYNYHAAFTHGCAPGCTAPQTAYEKHKERTVRTDRRIIDLLNAIEI